MLNTQSTVGLRATYVAIGRLCAVDATRRNDWIGVHVCRVAVPASDPPGASERRAAAAEDRQESHGDPRDVGDQRRRHCLDVRRLRLLHGSLAAGRHSRQPVLLLSRFYI